MITLNPDQERARAWLSHWWYSDQRYAVLEGVAGTGKTTIVSQLVKNLRECVPLFTAPTNEACRQLENALPKGSEIRTTYSALGFNFDTGSEMQKLSQMYRVSPIMNQISLLIVDECSMVGQDLLTAIEDAGKKTLFIGHRSQLPEVVPNLSVFDECMSVVFKQSFPLYTLTTPERNKGELFEFLNNLESLIYKTPRLFKGTYNQTSDFLMDYIHSKEGSKELLEERTKVICWSNAEVDKYNSEIRKCIFKDKLLPQFVLRDRILFCDPVSYFEPLEGLSKGKISDYIGSTKLKTFSSNTKGIVRGVRQTTVLTVPCWELEVEVGNDRPLVYVPIDRVKLGMLRDSLKSECKSYTTKQAQDKAWKRYHFIMSLFANVKHSYAITTHRSQGMTIPKVFVNWADIRRCQNVFMRQKLLYVACSRVRDELYIIT